MEKFQLRTGRLVLREWRDADREPFAEMNANPEVMEFFPSTLERQTSDVMVDRFRREFAELGFCPWALELFGVEAFIGFVGLYSVPDEMTFSPAVEVGWRLARPFWGQGYATEAAARVLRFGFDELGLEELVSFTSVVNTRSRKVMERRPCRVISTTTSSTRASPKVINCGRTCCIEPCGADSAGHLKAGSGRQSGLASECGASFLHALQILPV
jgi:RimJ/RimL family protein N-acetyltransferase